MFLTSFLYFHFLWYFFILKEANLSQTSVGKQNKIVVVVFSSQCRKINNKLACYLQQVNNKTTKQCYKLNINITFYSFNFFSRSAFSTTFFFMFFSFLLFCFRFVFLNMIWTLPAQNSRQKKMLKFSGIVARSFVGWSLCEGKQAGDFCTTKMYMTRTLDK